MAKYSSSLQVEPRLSGQEEDSFPLQYSWVAKPSQLCIFQLPWLEQLLGWFRCDQLEGLVITGK